MSCSCWIHDVCLSPAPADLWKMKAKSTGEQWEDRVSVGSCLRPQCFKPEAENKIPLLMIAVLLRIAKSRDFNFLNLTWKFLPRSDRGRSLHAWQVVRSESSLFTQSQELFLVVEGRRGRKRGRAEPCPWIISVADELCLLYPGHQPLNMRREDYVPYSSLFLICPFCLQAVLQTNKQKIDVWQQTSPETLHFHYFSLGVV